MFVASSENKLQLSFQLVHTQQIHINPKRTNAQVYLPDFADFLEFESVLVFISIRVYLSISLNIML